MSTKFCQTNTHYLAGSGSIVGATSIVLTTLQDIYGNVLTMTDFGSKGFITLEPDTSNEEAATFTGITANANGTYTLTGVKTGLAKSPYTETSGLIRGHSGGSKVVFTDNVEFWNTFANKANDENITGNWTFVNFPATPTTNPNASSTVKGITELSVDPAVLTTPIAVGTNDDRVPVGYAVDSVGTDSYAITPTPAETAYVTGKKYTFQAGTANTGACTLNVSGLGAKSIVRNVNKALQTGDILQNQIVTCIYDGTNMQMVSPHLEKRFSTATSSNSNSLPLTIAHGLGVIPTIDFVSIIGLSNASLSIEYGGGSTGRVNDGTTPGAGALVLGTDSSNYHVITVTADATNITVAKSTTGTPGNISFTSSITVSAK